MGQNSKSKTKLNNKTLLGCFCALGCEVLFGLSYVFTKQATEVAGTFELLGWRFFIAFLVMSVFVLAGVVKVHLKGKNIKLLLLVALFSPIIYFIGETMGIDNTSASESGVFLACIPIASLVASSLILKKKPTLFQMIGIGVTLAGVLITVFAVGSSATFSIFGYAFLTLAVISYALYSVFVEKASAFSEGEITYMMLALGAVFFGSVALVKSIISGNTIEFLKLPFENTSFLIAILYQGIGCSILAFFLSNIAISFIGVNRTSSFIGASTVVSILASVIVLKETLSAWQIAGAVIIVLGIYTANITIKSKKVSKIE